MELFDVTIIGAGAVGLSIAAELSRHRGISLAVLERNDSFGMETSSRNSEVIHAGIYYPPGFLKGRLCVEGNSSLYEYCRTRNIPHRRTGKLITAVEKSEEEDLAALKEQASANGVDDLEFLTSRQAHKLEPLVKSSAALLSPSTGIIDSHALMRSFLAEAQSSGTVFSFRSEVTSIRQGAGFYEIEVNRDYSYKSRVVVNSAGLRADSVAAMAGLDIDLLGCRLKLCKGSYFSANPPPRVNMLVYPVPARKNEGLGIHAVLDLGGRVRFGPDVEYVDSVDYRVDPGKAGAFHAAVSRYLPGLARESLWPDMSGIRPKLQGPGEPYRDFVIRDETDNGSPGFINLVGIESPGLTSCIPIARLVSTLAEPHL